MKQLLIAVLLTTSISAQAKLCKAQVCKSTDSSKCVPAFLFVADKPTKTLSGTVSTMPACKPLPVLIEDVDADKDGCFAVELTYLSTESGKVEKYWYKNGATSTDNINWDREQNPGCPAIP